MREEDARRQLEEILKDASPGDQASVQTEGQINHPHGEDNHTDGWGGTKQADGSVRVEKLHS